MAEVLVKLNVFRYIPWRRRKARRNSRQSRHAPKAAVAPLPVALAPAAMLRMSLELVSVLLRRICDYPGYYGAPTGGLLALGHLELIPLNVLSDSRFGHVNSYSDVGHLRVVV